MQTGLLAKLFQKKPYLAWYISDRKNLSDESKLEHILNYGNWDDFLKAEEELGLKRINAMFKKITGKKRVNLRPQTVNYFSKYLGKYA